MNRVYVVQKRSMLARVTDSVGRLYRTNFGRLARPEAAVFVTFCMDYMLSSANRRNLPPTRDVWVYKNRTASKIVVAAVNGSGNSVYNYTGS